MHLSKKSNYLIILLLKIIVIISLIQSANATENKLGSFSIAGVPPKGAQIVTVGFYPRAIYDLTMQDNTFHLHTLIWMRWKGDRAGPNCLNRDYQFISEYLSLY